MTDDGDVAPTGERLLERVKADANEVDLENILSVVTDGDPDEDVTVAFATWLEAGAGDPDRAAERLLQLLDDDDYVVRIYAGKLAVELAAGAPAALAPHAGRLAEIAATDDLVADSAMDTLRFVVDVDSGALLSTRDRLPDLLEHDIQRVRDGALIVVAELSNDHPDALIDLVPSLVSMACGGSTGGSGSTIPADGSASPEAPSDGVRQPTDWTSGPGGSSHGGDSRKHAAYAVARIAAADPTAVEPHLPDVYEGIDSQANYAAREFLLDAVRQVAGAHPDAVIDDVDEFVEILVDEGRVTPGMQAAAARLLVSLAHADAATVVAAVEDTDGALDACRSLLEADKSPVWRSADALLTYLSDIEGST